MDFSVITKSINEYESDKEELTEIAAQVAGLTQSFINKEISESEYVELLDDIKLEGVIVASSIELTAKEDLKFIIDSAITIANIAASAI